MRPVSSCWLRRVPAFLVLSERLGRITEADAVTALRTFSLHLAEAHTAAGGTADTTSTPSTCSHDLLPVEVSRQFWWR